MGQLLYVRALSCPVLTDVKPAPLLATVTGILLSLTVRCHGELRNRGVAAVTAELGWDIAKLSEVLGKDIARSWFYLFLLTALALL